MSLFQIVLNRKNFRQKFAYTDFAIGLIQTQFHWLYQVHGDTKLSDIITQDIPLNWNIACLDIHKQLMLYFIVLPFFL